MTMPMANLLTANGSLPRRASQIHRNVNTGASAMTQPALTNCQ